MRLDFECWAGLVCPGHTLPGSGPKTSATTSVWAAHLIRHSPAAGLKRCRDDLGDLPMNPGIHHPKTVPRDPGKHTRTHTVSLRHTQWGSRLPVSEKALPDLLLPYGWGFKCWNMLEYPGTQQMDYIYIYVHNPNYCPMCLLGRDFRHCGYQQTPQPMERKWTAHDSIHV